MNDLKKRSFKAAFGGITAALSVVLMFTTGIIPVLTYAIPLACGVLLVVLVIEIGSKFAFSVYAAVALLSIFLVADKESAVMYAMFFGYYPIVKAFFEKHFKGTVCWIFKFLLFNAAVIAAYFLTTRILGIPFEEMGSLGKYTPFVLLAAGNFIFLLYDNLLTNLITLYLRRWQKYLRRVFK